jgi:hypothetical protein
VIRRRRAKEKPVLNLRDFIKGPYKWTKLYASRLPHYAGGFFCETNIGTFAGWFRRRRGARCVRLALASDGRTLLRTRRRAPQSDRVRIERIQSIDMDVRFRAAHLFARLETPLTLSLFDEDRK